MNSKLKKKVTKILNYYVKINDRIKVIHKIIDDNNVRDSELDENLSSCLIETVQKQRREYHNHLRAELAKLLVESETIKAVLDTMKQSEHKAVNRQYSLLINQFVKNLDDDSNRVDLNIGSSQFYRIKADAFITFANLYENGLILNQYQEMMK
ncbi:hypothetical protein ACQW5G_07065 [Fructilactobacillus sp. Tb1]|uniref:hypothetical protein n=1 Tax=Fructilactobacillus sp. Tb1 TaxID=3422304 RepID=UPI003D2AC55B